MRTEDELRAALRSLESEAPHAAAVLPRQQDNRHGVRRRVVLLAGAAAVTAAAVPVAARLLTDRGSTPAVEQDKLHPFEFVFTVEPYDGYEVSGYAIGPGSGQVVNLRNENASGPRVVVHQRGEVDGAALPAGEPVTIAGRPGRYVEIPVDLPGGPFPGVFWEYAPDSWAGAWDLGTGDQRAASLRAAGAVRFGRGFPMRLPYLTGPLPLGLRPHAGRLEVTRFGNATWHSLVQLTGPDGPDVQLNAVDPRDYESSGEPAITAPVGEPVLLGTLVRVRFETFVVMVGTIGPNGLPGAPIDALTDVARSLTPAPDFGDQDTWFDPRRAFPL